jgi:hypothetical protein
MQSGGRRQHDDIMKLDEEREGGGVGILVDFECKKKEYVDC